MMKWTRTLVVGVTLIVLTNAVVLLGATYNRSGDPESQLRLTQRELQHSQWRAEKDNSGITLELNWRILPAQLDRYDRYSAGRWEMPAWLDKVKLEQLGFDVAKLASERGYGRRDDIQPREVLLVLELNGPAYLQAVQRARIYADQAKALLAANSRSERDKESAKDAAENYRDEQLKNSRLFVIDAGVDLQKLRATYPDRTRYVIVHGLVRPTSVQKEGGTKIGGQITELHAERINVPYLYREVFINSAAFEVTVAFGQRLEPWIVAASRAMATNQSEEKK
ncbi:MAG: hypothetical protein A2061_00865 [Gallionellales bacterium GWA2_59_43]|nr:MAG: hypothetical protein A2061_00865 [Gallionellales bacterium GWA2_59_43]